MITTEAANQAADTGSNRSKVVIPGTVETVDSAVAAPIVPEYNRLRAIITNLDDTNSIWLGHGFTPQVGVGFPVYAGERYICDDWLGEISAIAENADVDVTIVSW